VHDLRGHKRESQVTSIAVHPSERVALSTANDNSLRMWDLVQGKAAPRKKLEDFKTLSCACWAPDGKRYALVGNDNVVVILDAGSDEDDRPLGSLVHPKRVNALRFVEDVVLVSGCDDGVVRVIGADGSLMRSLNCQSGERPVRVRDVGAGVGEMGESILVAACSDGAIRVWNLDDDESGDEPLAVLNLGTAAHVTCMAVSSTSLEVVEDEKSAAVPPVRQQPVEEDDEAPAKLKRAVASKAPAKPQQAPPHNPKGRKQLKQR
jgi:protein MAK11